MLATGGDFIQGVITLAWSDYNLRIQKYPSQYYEAASQYEHYQANRELIIMW
jgi:hypothetical protein